MNARLLFLPVAAVTVLGGPAYSKVYLTVEQAQARMFAGAKLTPSPITLTAAQVSAIEQDSGVSVRSPQVKAWRASSGGWLIVDEVVGKHEFITYALALDNGGAVRDIEVMDYREAYGYEIMNPGWRSQFRGKQHGAALRLTGDIQNISGATLSCRHITDGVRRLLATYAIALASAGR